MAWVATENFNSYSDGDLNANNGGSGWAGAWTQSAGTISVQGTTVYEGAKAISSPSGSAQLYYRQLTSTTSSGIVSFRLRMTATTIDGAIVLEETSGAGKMYFRIAPDGNFKIFDNGGGVYQTIQAYSTDTWYLCEMEFDDASQPEKYRARVDGGSWTSWYTVNGATYASIGYFRIDRDNNTGVLYVDDIKEGSSVSASTAGYLTLLGVS